MVFRPGTSELWSGDVGGSLWEEVNRMDMSTFTGPVNRGWPGHEGTSPAPSASPAGTPLNKPVCEALYAAETPAAPCSAPYFSYRTRGGGFLTPARTASRAPPRSSGFAFIPSTSNYPTAYRGSLFFNDYARGCIWRLGKLGNGDPDPNSILPFVEAADTPVAIEIGPGGDLYDVDYGIVDGVPTGGAGDIHRITYTTGNRPPVAALTANPSAGPAPLTCPSARRGSTDPDGDPLTYEWALDGDGVFNDGAGVTKTKTYNGTTPVTVQVRVSDGRSRDTEQVVVSPGNSPPTITAMSPASSLTWSVGQPSTSRRPRPTPSSRSRTARTPGPSPSSTARACATATRCPPGSASGPGLPGPRPRVPLGLLLQVTVTDSQGLTDTETFMLDPKSVPMTFASNPTGAALTVAGAGLFAPHNQTFIQGSNFNVTAPATRVVGGANYNFTSWSDGGAATHAVVAPTSATTLTANYMRQNRLPTVTVAPTRPPARRRSPSTSPPAPPTRTATTRASPTRGTSTTTAPSTTPAARPSEVGADLGRPDRQGPGLRQPRRADTDQVTVTSTNQAPARRSRRLRPARPDRRRSRRLQRLGSTDPNGHTLTYAWDLDNDGASTTDRRTASRRYSSAPHLVRVRATDCSGHR